MLEAKVNHDTQFYRIKGGVGVGVGVLTKRNCLYFQPIRLQLRRYPSGYLWNRKYEGCLQTQFKHLPPQLALKLSFVRLQSFQISKEVYELRNFTYTNAKNCQKCSFLSGIFCRASSIKSQNIVVTRPSTPLFFCRNFLKLLSPTLPILMNWILLSPPPVLRP